jgi:hypothetical protein
MTARPHFTAVGMKRWEEVGKEGAARQLGISERKRKTGQLKYCFLPSQNNIPKKND